MTNLRAVTTFGFVFSLIVVFFISGSILNEAKAGHRGGGYFSWECVAPDSIQLQYTFRVGCYTNVPDPEDLCWYENFPANTDDGQLDDDDQFLISEDTFEVTFCSSIDPGDVCKNNEPYNWFHEVTYGAILYIDVAEMPYHFEYCGGGGRPGTTTNNSPGWYIDADMMQMVCPNTTPRPSHNPLINFCDSMDQTLQLDFSDPDGDSLSFTMVDCEGDLGNGGGGQPINYNNTNCPPMLSGANPFCNDYITVDPLTGNVSFYAIQEERATICLDVEEWRGGVLLSVTTYEYWISILDCDSLRGVPDTLPVLVDGGGPGNLPNGAPFCLDVGYLLPTSDSGGVINVLGWDMDILLQTTGATFDTTVSDYYGELCWTPPCNADTQYIYVYLEDENCPFSTNWTVEAMIVPDPPQVSIPIFNPVGHTCGDLTVDFVNTSQFDTTWVWDISWFAGATGDPGAPFPMSIPSTLPHDLDPNHDISVTFPHGGDFWQVCLTTVANCPVESTNQNCQIVSVTEGPGAFAGPDTALCAREIGWPNIQLLGDTVTGTGSFPFWSTTTGNAFPDFDSDGDFTPSNILHPTYTVGLTDSLDGRVCVQLTAFSGIGCTPTADTMCITLYPIATPLMAGPDTVCEFRTDTFAIPNNGGTGVTWGINPGSAFGGTFSILPGSGDTAIAVTWPSGNSGGIPDTIYATEITVLGNCPSYDSLLVWRFDNPEPIIDGVDPVCEFTQENYSVTTVVPGNTFLWTCVGGTIVPGTETLPTASINWGATGVGSVTLIETDGITFCDSLTSIPVTIHPRPNPTIVGPNILCEHTTDHAYSIGATLDILNWVITPPANGTVTTGQGTTDILIDWHEQGVHTVILFDTNAFGCDTIKSRLVLVNPRPEPNIIPSIGAGYDPCEFDNFQYCTPFEAGATYWWDSIPIVGGSYASTPLFGPGINCMNVTWGDITGNPAYLAVYMTNSFGCDSSDTVEVVIHEKPDPVITGPADVCIHQCDTFTNALWQPAPWSQVWNHDSDWGVGTVIDGGQRYVICFTDTVTLDSIELTQTADDGTKLCDSTVYFPLQVHPKADPLIVGDQTVCEDFGTYMYVNSNILPGYSNLWTVGPLGTIVGPANGDTVYVDWAGPGPIADQVCLLQTATVAPFCDSLICLPILIQQRPQDTIIGPDVVCEYTSEFYSASPGGLGAANYNWSVTGGNIMGGAGAGLGVTAILVNWEGSGAGTVTFTVFDPTTQCDSIQVMNVTIDPKPDPDILGGDACEFTTGNLFSTPSDPNSIYVWTIPGGTFTPVAPPDSSSIDVTWSSEGTNIISLHQTNQFGCDTTETFSVTVNPKPDPGIIGITPVCEHDTVVYSAAPGSTQPGIGTYTWTPTNGTVDGSNSGSTVTVIWGEAPPNGQIQLTTQNGFGCDSILAAQPVLLSELPSPVINGPIVMCDSSNATYTVSPVTGGVTYTWTVTGGNIVGGANPGSSIDVFWLDNGLSPGRVTLHASKADGCDTTVFVDVILNPRPTPAINGTFEYCENELTAYYNILGITANDTGFVWTVTNGTETVLTPLGNEINVDWGLNSNGPSSLEVLVQNNFGCDSSVSIPIILNPKPRPFIAGPSVVCEETCNHIYSTPAVVNSIYVWDVGNGVITPDPLNPNIISVCWGEAGSGAAAPDSVIVTETDTITGCDTLRTLPVTISIRPEPAIAGQSPVCELTNGIVYETPDHGGLYSWSVVGGTGVQSPDTAYTVAWGPTGAGSVTVTETLNGCDSTVSLPVAIHPKPVPVLTGPDTLCEFDNSSYVFNTPFDNLSTYTWTTIGGDSLPGSNNAEIIFASNAGGGFPAGSGGSVTVLQTNQFGCDSTVSMDIHVFSKPVPVIIGEDSTCEYAGSYEYSFTPVPGILPSWSILNGTQDSPTNTNTFYDVTFGGAGFDTIVLYQEHFQTGCDSSDTMFVEVFPKPDPAIAGTDPVCENDGPYTYSTPFISGTYGWTITNGTNVGTTPNSVDVIWGSPPSGTVTVHDTVFYNDLACDTSETFPVIIQPEPKPIIGGNPIVCENRCVEVYSMTPTFVPNSVMTWEVIGGGSTLGSVDGEDTLLVCFGSAGPAQVIVHETNTSTSCNNSDTFNVTINAAPTPSITGDDTVCGYIKNRNYCTALTVNPMLWTISGGTITSDPSLNCVSVDWGAPGTGYITITETLLSTGCVTVVEDTIHLEPTPIPVISGPDSVCENTSGHLYSTVQDPPNTYIWSIIPAGAGVISGGSNPAEISIEWNTVGTHTVQVIETNSFLCDSIVTFDVVVNPRPVPVITGDDSVCEYTPLNNYSTPAIPGNIYSWTIVGGTPLSAPNNSISIDWGAAGVGLLEVYQQTILTGCDSTAYDTVQILSKPNPNITGVDTACEDEGPYTFCTNNQVNNTYGWTTSGGGVITSTGNCVDVQWASPGEGIVFVHDTLWTGTIGCDTTESDTVVIEAKPHPLINGSDEVCANKCVEVYSIIPSAVTTSLIDWTFPFGNGSLDPSTPNGSDNVLVCWGAAGAGAITICETDAILGCDSCITLDVTIKNSPAPLITGPDTACAFIQGRTYCTPPSIGNTMLWTITNGTIVSDPTLNCITVDWGADPEGIICIEEIDPITGCTTQVCDTIVLLPTPIPLITGPDEVCEETCGHTYQTNQTVANAYTWSVIPLAAGTISNGGSPNEVNVCWHMPGTWTIQVIEENGFLCDSLVTFSVTVNPRPIPLITGPDSVCEFASDGPFGTTVLGGHTYDWTISGGTPTTSTANPLNITWGTAGLGTIEVVETIFATGCDSVARDTIRILPKPDPNITGQDSVCEFDGETYCTPLPVAGTHAYVWTISNGTINGGINSNDCVDVVWGPTGLSGTISVTETITYGTIGCDTTETFAVEIGPKASPVIIGNSPVCENLCEEIYEVAVKNPGSSYNWGITGGSIFADFGDSVQVCWDDAGGSPGILQVTETNAYGCDSTITDTVDILPRPTPVIVGEDDTCSYTYGLPYSITDIGFDMLWTIENGTILSGASTANVIVNWDTAGIGIICITETDPITGCFTEVCDTVDLRLRPEPQIMGLNTVCSYTDSVSYSTNFSSGNNYTWTLPMGGGTIVLGPRADSIYVHWGAPGNYQVQVHESNGFGCDSIYVLDVLIETTPEPLIIGADSVCELSGPHVYAVTAVPGITHDWTIFGGSNNGPSFTNPTISVNWGAPDSGSVCITQVSAINGCDTTQCFPVVILPKPVPTITGIDTVCEFTGPHTYNTLGGLGHTLSWTVTNGGIQGLSTNNTVDINWQAPGNGVLTLNDIYTVGTVACDSTVDTTIIITSKPDPQIGGTDTVCSDRCVEMYGFTPVYPGFSTISWEIIGGYPGSADGTDSMLVCWDGPGAGQVIVNVIYTVTGCDSSDTLDVTIEASPDPVVVGPSDTCALTGPITYSVLPTANTFSWDIENGTILSGGNTNEITVYWDAPGIGVLWIEETHSVTGCITIVSDTINLLPRPVPVISGPDTVCEFTDNHVYSTAGNILNVFSWSINPPTAGTIQLGATNVATINWFAAGDFQVLVNELNSSFCDSTVIYNVHVNPRPTPTIVTDDSVCEFGPSLVPPSVTPVAGHSYLWTVTNGTPITGTNPSLNVEWDGNGFGFIELYQQNIATGCDTVVFDTVIILDKPVPVITGPDTVCEKSNEDYSVLNIPGNTYQWTLLGGNSADLTNPVVSVDWGLAGFPASVSVNQTIIYPSLSCDSSVSLPVVIISKPAPVIDGNITVCENLCEEIYEVVIKNPGSSYNWVIGNGLVSVDYGDSVLVCWDDAATGPGTVTVTETNDEGCDSTISLTVNLDPRPTPVITGTMDTCAHSENMVYCVPLTPNTYSWVVNGGVIDGPANGNCVTVDWDGPGIGELIVTETDPNCFTTVIDTVDLRPRPEPIIVGPNDVCSFTDGHPYTVVSYTAIHSYDWSINPPSGGNISSGINDGQIVVDWLSPGTYDVILTETNDSNCDSTIVFTVTVNPRPAPVIVGADSVCEFSDGNPYNTADIIGNTYSWTITGGNTTTPTSSNINVSWEANGLATIQVNELNTITGCDTTVDMDVVIMPKPDPIISGPDSVCELSGPISFSTPVNGTNTFVWTMIGGNIVPPNTDPTIDIHFGNSGIAVISVTETTEFGCDTTEDYSVVILPKPTPVSVSGTTTVCENLCEEIYTVNPGNLTGVTYDWTVTNGSICAGQGTTAATVSWGSSAGSPGEVFVTVENALGCDSTVSTLVDILPRPVPVITGPDDTCALSSNICYSTPLVVPRTFLWTVQNGVIEGDPTLDAICVTWGPVGDGILTVTETNTTTGCFTTVSDTTNLLPRPTPVIVGSFTGCENSCGNIYASSTFNVLHAYAWNVVGGTFTLVNSNPDSIDVCWDDAGLGTVTLTETAPSFCDSTVFINVTIEANPDPIITGPDTVCSDTEHDYSVTSNPGATYSWTVLGGVAAITNQASISVIWGAGPVGYLEVHELGANGCDTLVKDTVVIQPRPAPSLSGPGPVCRNTCGHLYSVGNVFNTSYNWVVSQGTISSGQGTNQIEVCWDGIGTGNVQITQTNLTTLCDSTVDIDISIEDRPNLVMSAEDSVCAGQCYTYMVTNMGGVIYNWTATNGTISGSSTSNSVTVCWDNTLSGQVTMEATLLSTGCVTTLDSVITILPVPTPIINLPQLACAETGSHNYFTPYVVGNSYQWVVSGGFMTPASGDTSGIEVSWGTAGNGTLQLTETNDHTGCATVIDTNVVINPIPTPLVIGFPSVCEGDQGNFYSVQVDNTPNTYFWTVNMGSIANGQTAPNVEIDWFGPGTGTISVTETMDGTGCIGEDQMSILIDSLPNAGIQALANSVCAQSVVDFSPQVFSPFYSYSWTVSPAAAGTIVPGANGTASISFNGPQNATVTLTVTDLGSNCPNSEDMNIIIETLPTPVVTIPAGDFCEYTCNHTFAMPVDPDLSYSWAVTGGYISVNSGNSIDVCWQAAGPGTVCLTVTDINTLCEETQCEDVIIHSSPLIVIDGPDTVCNVDTVVYSVNPSAASYNWTAVAGSQIIGSNSGQSVTIAWNGITGGQICVDVVDAFGCDTSLCLNVGILVSPNPIVEGPDSSCAGSCGNVYTTAEAFDPFSIYDWTVNGGTFVLGANPNEISVCWNSASPGEVCLSQTGPSGCVIDICKTVIITSLPAPLVTGPAQVCEFTGTYLYETPIVFGNSYSWEISNGSEIAVPLNDNQINVDWDGVPSGSVEVTETIDLTGCDSTYTLAVLIEGKPDPVITGTLDVCANGTYVYQTPNTGNTYSWEAIGGATIITNLDSVEIVWGTAGLGSVIVTETTPFGCDTSETLAVTIHANPLPAVNGVTVVCENTCATYSTLPNGGMVYSWEAIGGAINGVSTSSNVEVCWGLAPAGQIIVNELDTTLGCLTSDTFDVNIDARPIPAISDPGIVCQGDTVTYTYNFNPGTADTITCSGDCEVLNPFNPGGTFQVVWGLPGAGNVCLQQTNLAGCDSTVCLPTVVSPVPTPLITGPIDVCEFTENHVYCVDNVGGMTYDWVVTGATIFTGQNTECITVQWDTEGIGSVAITETNIASGCNTFIDTVINIHPRPEPVVSGEADPCENTCGHIYSVNPVNIGSSYSWVIVGGTTPASTSSTVEVCWGAEGLGSLTLVEETGNQCDSFAVFPVVIRPRPNTFISGLDTVCENSCSHNFSTPLSIGNVYTWTINGGVGVPTIDGNENEVCWGLAGLGSIEVNEVDPSFGCDSSHSIPVVILDNPTPSINGPSNACELSGPFTYFTASTSNHSYSWDISPVGIGTIVNPNSNSVTVLFADITNFGNTATLTVTQTNDITGCDTTVALVITLDPKPYPVISGPAITCEMTDSSTYTVAPFDPANTYSWSVIGGMVVGPNDGQNVVIDWIAAGGGTVFVQAISPAGCDSIDSLDVIIQPRPNPVVLGNLDTVCAHTCENIFSTPPSAGETYLWDVLGGGTFSLIQPHEIEVCWGDMGLDTLCLTVFNSITGCDTTMCIELFVDSIPKPVITGPDVVCEFTEIHTYTTNGVPGNTYNWAVTGGTILNINQNSVDINWSASGTGFVYVTEMDGFTFCDTTAEFEVLINPRPTPEISGPASACELTVDHIYGVENGVSGHTYTYTLSGGTFVNGPGLDEVTINWGVVGDGILCVQETNLFGCDSSDCDTITILSAPHPEIIGPDDLCEFTAGWLYDAEFVPGNSYEWVIENGQYFVIDPADSSDAIVSWNDEGMGVVILTEDNGVCDSTVTDTVTLLPRPEPIVSGPNQVCEYTGGHIYDSPADIDDIFVWTITGGTGVSTPANPEIVEVDWNGFGTGYVELFQTNEFGCDSTDTMIVDIDPKPDPVITGPPLVCEYECDNFYSVVDPGGTQFNWTVVGATNFTGQGTDIINVCWDISGAGQVFVTQTTDSSSCDTTVSFDVNINDHPEQTVSGPDSVCEYTCGHEYNALNTSGGTTLWSVTGGTITSGQGGPLLNVCWDIATNNGQVCLTETHPITGCDTTYCFDVVVSPKPEPLIVGMDSVCENTCGNMYTNGLGLVVGENYTWTVNGGTYVLAPPATIEVCWGNTGAGDIDLHSVNTLTGCDTTVNFLVDINPKPVPVITGPDTSCEEQTIIYSVGPCGTCTFNWVATGGIINGPIDLNTVSVTWGTTGTGNIEVSQVNFFGCDTVVDMDVDIRPNPSPVVIGSNVVCEYDTLVYSTQNYLGNSYNWTVNNGTIINGQGTETIDVDWMGSGNGDVCVIEEVIATGCSTEVCIIGGITIIDNPEPEISGDLMVCEFDTLTYSTPLVASTYQWDVIGGIIVGSSTNSTVDVLWGSTGAGQLCVTEVLGNSCDTTVCIDATIFPKPDPQISGPFVVCELTDQVYTYPGFIAGNTLLWTVTGGTIVGPDNGNSVDVHWDIDGVGSICLSEVMAGSGCDTVVCESVTIHPKPSPVIAGNIEVCEFYGAECYSTVGVPGHDYEWVITGEQDSIISGFFGEQVCVTWGTSGFGDVTVTEINSTTGCDSTISVGININPRPEPAILGPDQVCEYDTFVYSVPPLFGNTYEWEIMGGCGTALGPLDQNFLEIAWAGAGTCEICITQSITQTGCDSMVCMNILIESKPTPVITGPSEVCEETEICYSTTDFQGHDYDWVITGGIPTNTNGESEICILWGQAGMGWICVTETVIGTGCDSSICILDSIIIHPNPEPVITGLTEVCEHEEQCYSTPASPDMSFEWIVTGGVFSSASNSDQVCVMWGETGPGSLCVIETNIYTGCSTEVCETTTIFPHPEPVITGGDDVVCEYSTVQYCTPNLVGNTYLWVVNGGTIVGDPTLACIDVAWGSEGGGTMCVTQTITQTGCDTTVCLGGSITILPNPEPEIIPAYPVCEHTCGNVYSTAFYSDHSYVWDVLPAAASFTVDPTNPAQIEVCWGETGAGSVSVTEIIDSSGCDTTYILDVNIGAIPVVELIGPDTVCEHTEQYYYVNPPVVGDSFAWTVVNGAYWYINDTHDSIKVVWGPEGPGQVLLNEFTPEGCDTLLFMDVLVQTKPNVSIIGPISPICAYNNNLTGLAVVTGAGGDLTYDWILSPGLTALSALDGPGIEFNAGPPGLNAIIVNVSNSIGCDTVVRWEFQTVNAPHPVILGDFTPCARDSMVCYETQSLPNVVSTWSFPGAELVIPDDNEVCVYWTDSMSGIVQLFQVDTVTGCDSTHIDSIVVNPTPTLILYDDTIACEDFTIDLDLYSFEHMDQMYVHWDGFGYSFESPVMTFTEPGVYDVFATIGTDLGCSDTAEIEVTVVQTPEASFEMQSNHISGDFIMGHSINLANNSVYPDSTAWLWTWGTGDSLTEFSPTISYPNTGGPQVVMLMATEPVLGCADTTVEYINVDVGQWAFIPSAFSPNDDNVNDVFYIETNGLKAFEILIFDRWGKLIYQSLEPSFKWDGTFQNRVLPEGVYVYRIIGKDFYGKDIKAAGSITLIR